MTLPIDPETRVGDLLDAYPEAERILVELAPPFAALKNPVLRRTVARVATLEQAARVGGIATSELVASLRTSLGVTGQPVDDGVELAGDVVPDWVRSSRPDTVIDADGLLASGMTPLTEVHRILAGMSPGQRLDVHAGFEPAPLIDALRARGHGVDVSRGTDNQWLVHIRRR